MIRSFLIAPLLTAPLLLSGSALAQEDVTLEPGPGLDTVTANCAVCHTLNYIVINSVFLTRDQWKAEVTKMQKAFGAPFDDQAAAEIVRYLAATYAVPPKR